MKWGRSGVAVLWDPNPRPRRRPRQRFFRRSCNKGWVRFFWWMFWSLFCSSERFDKKQLLLVFGRLILKTFMMVCTFICGLCYIEFCLVIISVLSFLRFYTLSGYVVFSATFLQGIWLHTFASGVLNKKISMWNVFQDIWVY